MNGNTLAQLDQARLAIENGNFGSARRILLNLLNVEPKNVRAWLWLAGITESPRASMSYIRRAQLIAPNDPLVREAVSWAQKRVADTATPVRVVPQTQGPERTKPVREDAPAPQPAASTPAVGERVPPPPARPAPPRAANEPQVRSGLVQLVRIVLIVVLLLAIAWLAYQMISTLLLQPQSGTGSGFDGFIAAQLVSAESQQSVADRAVSADSAPDAARAVSLLPKSTGNNQATMPRWTPTPSPTPTPLPPTPTPTSTPAPVVATSDGFDEWRWIDVNLTTQTLVAYENNVPVFSTLISSGTWETPTVTGQFRVYYRLPQQDMNGYAIGFDYYLPNVPHVQYFYEDYALHGTYWHSNFGTPMSHGCVNLTPTDAQWLYNFAGVGTLVNVHY